MRFSIIIPVYNAENTLERCVDSIIKQEYYDYEIILVNDGSSDSSLDICKSYCRRCNHVRCIDKANGGASSARNAGLNAAQGDYILFVDSDDYVNENYFDVIDSVFCEDGLAVFTYDVLKSGGSSKRSIDDGLNQSDLFEKTRYLILSRTINSPYSKIFDRRLIEKNSLRFDARMPVAEDFNFCLAYLMLCKNVSIFNTSIYTYDITNDDSLVRKRKKGLIDIYPVVFDEAYNTINHSDFSNSEKDILYRIWDKLHVDSFGTCVMEELKDTAKSSKEIKNEIKSMCVKFYSQYPGGYGYQNVIHRVMRICIKNKWSSMLYILGKQYVKMRG